MSTAANTPAVRWWIFPVSEPVVGLRGWYRSYDAAYVTSTEVWRTGRYVGLIVAGGRNRAEATERAERIYRREVTEAEARRETK